MGRIKSALEIALERTESVKTDKESIGLFEARQQGKRLANAFLADTSKNLEDELKKCHKNQWESLKQGIFDVLAPQISLPASAADMQRIEAVGKGLRVLINDSRFTAMYKQLMQVLSRYLDESAQYEQIMRQQYAPKLRQKEEELSRRIGREVRLDPFQDPEFVAIYNQNLNALKANYQAAVDQVREEAQKMRSDEGK
jgi:predicted component of type VI protein secretion system